MRFKTIKIIYFVILFLIVLRLGYWQVVRSDELSAKAEKQRVLVQEVEAPRGDILFKDKSVLAASQPTFLVYVQPKLLAQKETDLKKLYAKKVAEIFWEDQVQSSTDSAKLLEDQDLVKQQVLGIEKEVEERFNKDLYWVSLGRNVTEPVKQKLEKLNIPGLGFENRTARFYPEGSSSAHLLGFVGSDIYGVETGYFGLEGYYNGELKGKDGTFTQERDALGFPILIGKFLTREPKQGKTLVLNIDRTVQHIVEQNLQKGVEKYGAKDGSVVIMEPSTGNILAMASYPGYDPAKPGEYQSENYKNPLTADAYEPGSTFKVLVMGAALNEEIITPETQCEICSGPVELGGFSIRTWNNKYQPNATMTDVLVHSDNTGMVFIAQKMGLQKMFNYINKFGFGRLTGIDLQDEVSPDLRSMDKWKEIDLATASFGQGISVTALQIVKAVGAIANGGKIMEPHVVSEIIDKDKITTIKPKVLDQPIGEKAAQQVKEMMVSAVDKGEAQYYKKLAGVSGYKIAGKTGTAQIALAGHYDPNKTIASFVGFAPADNPKFVMLVRYREPSASIFGADTAAPTFFNIAKDLFTYYGIAPTQ